MGPITFLHTQKAYLPELDAYIEYFKNRGVTCNTIYDPKEFGNGCIEWIFTGIDRRKTNNFRIHDYASLSVPPHARIKDWIKREINSTPDHRIFLNEFVLKGLKFRDNIPYTLRDMGISNLFFKKKINKKDYDFVYMGSISRKRHLDKFLEKLVEKKRYNILLIGLPEDSIYKKFAGEKAITFSGPVQNKEIPELAAAATAGVNITPNIPPYSIQTSTKLLEYCALGLPIITTPGQWVQDFEKKRKAKFFYLKNDFSNISDAESEIEKLVTPDVKDLEWQNLLSQIKLFESIQKRIDSAYGRE